MGIEQDVKDIKEFLLGTIENKKGSKDKMLCPYMRNHESVIGIEGTCTYKSITGTAPTRMDCLICRPLGYKIH